MQTNLVKNPLRTVQPLAAALLVVAQVMVSQAGSDDTPQSVATKSTSVPKEILTNGAVIELKQAGFGEALIIDTIKAATCKFDTTISGLKQLKAAGLADSVISTMIAANAAGRNGASSAASVSDPGDPASPHEAGIWLSACDGAKTNMSKLEPSVYSQHRAGTVIFPQFGQSVKYESVIRGAHAEAVTTERRPVFYFYFESTHSGLSNSKESATSPNEYTLSQFESVEKENHRRLVMGQSNAYSGSENGADGKSVRSFTFQKLAPGVYRVCPKVDLANGEYGFFYAANNGGGKVFDFGVRVAPEKEAKLEGGEGTQKLPSKANSSKAGGSMSKGE